jgi:glutaredoxin
MAPSDVVEFYTRAGCELCDEGRAALQEVLEERAAAGRRAPPVRVIDVDLATETRRRFGEAVPVLVVGERELHLATGGTRIRSFLDEALPSVLA